MNVALSVRKGHREKFIGLTNFRYSEETYSCPPHLLEKTSHLGEANEYIRNIHFDKEEKPPKSLFSHEYLYCDLVSCPPPPLSSGPRLIDTNRG
jgi:hypothetical protein